MGVLFFLFFLPFSSFFFCFCFTSSGNISNESIPPPISPRPDCGGRRLSQAGREEVMNTSAQLFHQLAFLYFFFFSANTNTVRLFFLFSSLRLRGKRSSNFDKTIRKVGQDVFCAPWGVGLTSVSSMSAASLTPGILVLPWLMYQ